MTVEIQPADAADEDSIVALWQACGLVAPYNDPVADFRRARAGAASDILVARDPAGTIRGSVLVGHDGHRGWLYYVSADPACRTQGVGRSIVRAAEAWLTQRGIAKVQLMVRETNQQVVGFYEQLGFELTPRIVMARWLDR